MITLMRIGAVWEPSANAHYRAFDPLQAMERRGHEVVWPKDPSAEPNVRQLVKCDVVHVYRHPYALEEFVELDRRGTPITYDNDDDFTAVPKDSRPYQEIGGLTLQRYFYLTVKVARLARLCTTTNEVLAEKYRRAGVGRVEVIGNYLTPDTWRQTNRHDGLVVGWVAAREHEPDAARLKLADALERLLLKHPHVRVDCIGVDLRLQERYRHDDSVPFLDLPRRIARFDIGIAPLVDSPFNRARSDIKLKEYGASGIPWLASPVGPYAELGEDQGGRLVSDDGWFEALDRLVTSGRDRRRLGRKAKRWAKGQTIERVADRWERLFLEAAG